MAKKWKVGELIKNLITEEGSAPRGEADAPGEADPAPSPAVAEEKPAPELTETQYLEMHGSLLELWKEFSDGELTPPRVRLLDEEKTEMLHLTGKKLEFERVRLTAQLEKDAKKRLEELRRAREGENGERSLDAVCHVYVSKDKLVAWCFAFPPYAGGEEMSSAMLACALEKAGVKTGIDPQSMVEIFRQVRYLRLIPVAFGQPETEGKDGYVTEKYPRELSREVVIDEHGVADYRAMNYVQLIKKDSVICEITPPVEGTPGMRLDGKPIMPRTVQAAKAPCGLNTTLTEDGLRLIATMDGHLEYSNGAFYVRPVLEIRGDVDYSTGNIDFIGDVQIAGDVRENFSVRATGSITVDGIVEAASVESGGDMTITRGVVGDNRAVLKCGGVFRVKYLENSRVYAGGSVYADCIMTSEVYSDQSIEVVEGRGSIIGGTLTAGELIRANMIGAQSGRKTELTLGVLPYTEHEREMLRKSVNEIEREIETIEGERRHMEIMGDKAKAEERRARLPLLQLKASRLAKKAEDLKEQVDPAKCRLECVTVYPVTVVQLGSLKWVADQVHRQCKLIYDAQSRTLRELSLRG